MRRWRPLDQPVWACLALLALFWSSCATAADLVSERQSELFGLTHRDASDRSYFLLSYVAASGSSFQVDPAVPSENLPCRVNDLRLAVGSGVDFGPAGVMLQGSLRIGLTDSDSPAAGPLEPQSAALRAALYWDAMRLAAGHLRLRSIHRWVRRVSAAQFSGRDAVAGAPLCGASASTMLEAAWACGIGRHGGLCARITWDLGGPRWRVGCPLAAHLDYRCYVNRRTYIQLGGLLGLEHHDRGWRRHPGVALAIGEAPGAANGMDVSGWVRTLGWEIRLAYQPAEDEPHSGTLLDRGSLLSLAVRLLR
ncbi:MAG: hypothetical protein GF330_06465 [Candidatus Eisenbacteria bacterium]|nr:hypothetical protein [Candidatus Eisenbacteria bacterium]